MPIYPVRRILLLLGAVLLLAPLPPAWSLPLCTSGTVASYLGTPCTIDDKEFSVTSYTTAVSGGPNFVLPADVTVTPIATPGNPGLLFSSTAWNVPVGVQETRIHYTVTVLPGGHLIDDATLTLAGVFTDQLGDVVTVDKLLCLGGGFCLGGSLDLNASSNGSVSTTFAPVGTIDVTDNIVLSALAQDDTAILGSVENDFSEVPEPSTLLLLGSGLAGLGGLAWRRRKS